MAGRHEYIKGKKASISLSLCIRKDHHKPLSRTFQMTTMSPTMSPFNYPQCNDIGNEMYLNGKKTYPFIKPLFDSNDPNDPDDEGLVWSSKLDIGYLLAVIEQEFNTAHQPLGSTNSLESRNGKNLESNLGFASMNALGIVLQIQLE